MISGSVIFAYLMTCAWLAYHNQKWDTPTVRFLVWLTSLGKPKPKKVDYGGIPVWRNGRLWWKFPEFDKS